MIEPDPRRMREFAIKTGLLNDVLREEDVLLLVFYLTVTLSNVGSLLEGRRWVYSVELARLATLLAVAGVLLALERFTPAAILAVVAAGVVSLAWFVRLRELVRPALLPG